VVLGLNLAVFFVAITVVEPWKRRRLAETLEKQIEEMGFRNAATVEEGLREVGRQLKEQRSLLGEGVQTMLETLQEQQSQKNAVPAETAKEIGEVPRESSPKRDVGIAAAVGAVTSGILGWIIHSWFST
jgi:sensitive to high expression protein 9